MGPSEWTIGIRATADLMQTTAAECFKDGSIHNIGECRIQAVSPRSPELIVTVSPEDMILP